ncbi:hypothetical protein A9K55_001204 [Cordyceps militaris]|uniref:Uncharacterized protein n=1 Tax=Cordyceps militaris TaxID=73501 RepID=A0A2H4SRX9_CORMI|nr:hypothetical protein A9K55_001204 [Cordyceps militaris]
MLGISQWIGPTQMDQTGHRRLLYPCKAARVICVIEWKDTSTNSELARFFLVVHAVSMHTG